LGLALAPDQREKMLLASAKSSRIVSFVATSASNFTGSAWTKDAAISSGVATAVIMLNRLMVFSL